MYDWRFEHMHHSLLLRGLRFRFYASFPGDSIGLGTPQPIDAYQEVLGTNNASCFVVSAR
jgi:hypothetical protein